MQKTIESLTRGLSCPQVELTEFNIVTIRSITLKEIYRNFMNQVSQFKDIKTHGTKFRKETMNYNTCSSSYHRL